ncbi:MAG: hypothetical protein V2J02_04090 [Pseudomonadales bacterium]|nr:hypothetical protein [Pseudomonadales bacterium]
MIEFLDPRAPTAIPAEPYDHAIDLAGRNDATVAYLANGFPDSVAFLEAVADALAELAPGLRALHRNKGNASIPAPAELLEEIAGGADCVVAAYGH